MLKAADLSIIMISCRPPSLPVSVWVLVLVLLWVLVTWCWFAVSDFNPGCFPSSLSVLWSALTTRGRSFLSHHMSALGLSRKSRLFSKTSSISEEPSAACRSVTPSLTSDLLTGPLSSQKTCSLCVDCLYTSDHKLTVQGLT